MSSLLVDSEHRVSTVELFFDLVFVFAFTQVTTLWLEQATWGGLGRGLLVICVLWWAWASYAWLTNAADVEADSVLGVMLFATGALFVAALAVPEAFGAQRFVFAVAFFTVLASFVGLYALVGRREPDLLAAVLRISWPVVSGAAVIVAAAFTPTGWRPAIWSLALVIGFFGPLLTGLEGWRVYPAHFAERHGLIVIIAIGESLGAIGWVGSTLAALRRAEKTGTSTFKVGGEKPAFSPRISTGSRWPPTCRPTAGASRCASAADDLDHRLAGFVEASVRFNEPAIQSRAASASRPFPRATNRRRRMRALEIGPGARTGAHLGRKADKRLVQAFQPVGPCKPSKPVRSCNPRLGRFDSCAAPFGFRARTPLRDGIERTVSWFRETRPALAAR